MKTIRIHQHGGPEVLKYKDVPVPTPDSTAEIVALLFVFTALGDVVVAIERSI